jgi:Fe-S cluster assembly ATP-binding protein
VSESRFQIQGLSVSIGRREVVRDLSLEVAPGEVHVIMGPNGSGKSSLAHALAGRPGYQVTAGHAVLDGVDLLTLPAHERARAGLFLALQHPLEVAGVRLDEALEAAGAGSDVKSRLADEGRRVGLAPALLDRFINVDLSGGERKRAEVVQLGVLRPRYAVLDEIDSGLDVDALAEVAQRLQSATTEWNCGVLAITHFERLLKVLTPTVIHVMVRGRLVASGGPELAATLERDGYVPFSTLPTS